MQLTDEHLAEECTTYYKASFSSCHEMLSLSVPACEGPKQNGLTYRNVCGMDHIIAQLSEASSSLFSESVSASPSFHKELCSWSRGFSRDSSGVPATLKGLLDLVQVQGPGPDHSQYLTAERLGIGKCTKDKQSTVFSPSGICHLMFLLCRHRTRMICSKMISLALVKGFIYKVQPLYATAPLSVLFMHTPN